MSKYAKEMDLIECISELESKAEWIEIDIENKTTEIYTHVATNSFTDIKDLLS